MLPAYAVPSDVATVAPGRLHLERTAEDSKHVPLERVPGQIGKPSQCWFWASSEASRHHYGRVVNQIISRPPPKSSCASCQARTRGGISNMATVSIKKGIASRTAEKHKKRAKACRQPLVACNPKFVQKSPLGKSDFLKTKNLAFSRNEL